MNYKNIFGKKVLKTGIVSIPAALVMIFAGCFFSSPGGKLVTPQIRALGLPESSIIASITLRVTGPDMEPVVVDYSTLPSLINISVPEGSDRTFELTVKTVSSYPGTVISYKGSATADITSDSARVTLNMGIGSTKIVVPDYINRQVLQFDDISGGNEKILKNDGTNNPVFSTWLSDNFISPFKPYDVDFDRQGRIYIANNGGGTGEGIIIRVDNITGLNPISIGSSEGLSSIAALTVDRTNNLVYYTSGTILYRSDLDGNNEVSLPLPSVGGSGISNILGITVDNEGMLYLVANIGQASADYKIVKCDPITSSTAVSLVGTSLQLPGNSLQTPKGAMVKNDRLYIANNGGTPLNQILQYSTYDLSLKGHYGNYTSGQDTAKGQFYGPSRFVAILNKKITVIDDGWYNDKIVSIDDINGTNWETLPESGTGQGLFKFFSGC